MATGGCSGWMPTTPRSGPSARLGDMARNLISFVLDVYEGGWRVDRSDRARLALILVLRNIRVARHCRRD